MSTHGQTTSAELNLKAGDWVEVRSKEEILRTLDEKGELDNMPFMPEMFAFCGRRLPVVKSAHKTCDTIGGTGGRRVASSVHLADARCDGQAHGGCEAKCLLFWKDAWLKKADGAEAPAPLVAPPRPSRVGECTEADVVAATQKPSDGKGGPTYSCQATELVRASAPLPWWDVRQYVEDYRTGNVGLRQLAEGLVYSIASNTIQAAKNRPRVQLALIAAYDRVQAMRGGRAFPRKTGTIPPGQKTPQNALNLQAGELVRVRSQDEVLATLDTESKNRGLYFDAENAAHCGGTYRVLSRVNKIVDEKTGKMVEFKNASLILDGAVCRAGYSHRRMFCPRAMYPYWREIWLERAEGAKDPAAPVSG
jgi:hypothetical protein